MRSSPAKSPRQAPQPASSTLPPPERIFVLGRGNLGRSLDRGLRSAGHSTSVVRGRTGFVKAPDSGLVLLAVPDGVVRHAAENIARLKPGPRVNVIHLSGALGLDVLAPLAGTNATGSFHPLQSFPEPRGPEAFRGITVAVDASTPELRRRLARLARDLGATPRQVDDASRVRYHAAAVFASNFVDVLIAEAASLLEEAGWTQGEAVEALTPLVEGTLQSIRRRGPVKALTGPIRRGDSDTVRRHLEAIGTGKRADLYRMLGAIALEIAREAGLEPAAAQRVNRALTRKVAATRRRQRR